MVVDPEHIEEVERLLKDLREAKQRVIEADAIGTTALAHFRQRVSDQMMSQDDQMMAISLDPELRLRDREHQEAIADADIAEHRFRATVYLMTSHPARI